MLRTTLRANQDTDLEDAISDLRSRCERARLAPTSAALLIQQVRSVLAPLIERGRELAQQGSQMSATREMNGEGYSVRLVFQAGGASGGGLLKRILGAFGR